MATDKAGCLGGNVCCLEQPSTASSVRVGQVRWGMGGWTTWEVPSSGWREEGDSPGKGELNSCSQPAVFSVAAAGKRKAQRSLLSRERLLTPDLPLEFEAGEAD